MNNKKLICGVLHLSSKVTYGIGKNGSVIKKFTPFETFKHEDSKYKTFYVKTKKIFNARDIYCIIKFTGIQKEGEIATGTVEDYIGEIGNKEAEIKYLKMICTASWSNNKIFQMDQYTLDIYSDCRSDINGLEIYTIDPSGCTDIDDAIHVKRISCDCYEVGIHIADVSSYIPINSLLDKQLAHRCETVYLNNCQINMMPTKLVEECSLVAGFPKRVFSVIVQLNEKLEIINIKFGHFTAKISKNLSYEQAQKMINKKIVAPLNLMYDLGNKLFNSGTNQYGLKKTYDTHVMVEMYMILANTLVADEIVKINMNNAILRRHVGSRRTLYEDRPEISEEVINKANIFLMSRAEYCTGTTENKDELVHVGLNKKLYTHFTSPIRRYIDILVHRMLDARCESDIKYLVNHANNVHTLYGKCERISNQLEQIYTLSEKYGKIIDSVGYIVDMDGSLKVKIYANEFDMVVDAVLFSDKLCDLIEMKFETSNNLETISLTSKTNNSEISLKMFQKVKIKIAVTLSMKYKLLVKIMEPDIMSLFDCTNENYTSDYSD